MTNTFKLTVKPLVSVLCVTYNQEKYIAQAIESFLMQKTNFQFEIIIHDDASTDKTTSIIQNYASQYPLIIRPLFEKQNQYSRGKQGFLNNMFKVAKGKYIALCEGDDYWLSPDKLQIQVDFLQGNPDYSVCFHPVKVFFENDKHKDYIFPEFSKKTVFSTAGLLKQNFIQTSSAMYKKQKYGVLPTDVTPHDWYFHLYHAQFGKIGFIDQVMSTYRRHPGGLWWNSYKDINKIWKNFGVEHLSLFVELLKIYGKNPAHKRILDQHIAEMIDNLIKANGKNGSGLLTKAFNKYPDLAEYFVLRQHQKLVGQAASLRQAENERDTNKLSLNQTRQLLTAKEREIRDIKVSRFWKARNVVARLIGKKPV